MTALLPTLRTVPGVDGVAIQVREHPGEPGATPVVLVHGLGSDASVNWELAGWVRMLRAAGRPVVAFDQRGHGASGRPVDPAAYRLSSMVGDLTAVLLATIGAGRTIDAIGYSLGSRVLLEYVGGAAPALPVRRLVLGGSAGQPLLRGMDPDGVDLAAVASSVPDHPETARIARTISALPTNDPLVLAALVRGLYADPDTVRRAPDPAMPTLVGVGTEDPLHDAARAWAAMLPAGEFVSLPGRNHVTAVPSGVFRTAAVGFLDGLGRAAGSAAGQRHGRRSD